MGRKGLAALVGRSLARIVANNLLAIVVELRALLGQIPSPVEVPGDVHGASLRHALATPAGAHAVVARDGACLPRVHKHVHGAVGGATWTILGEIASVLRIPAHLRGAARHEHAGLAAGARRGAALVGGVGKLASAAVTTGVRAGAVGAAAVAVLAILHEAIATDGVTLYPRRQVLEALPVRGIGVVEERGDVSHAAGGKLLGGVGVAHCLHDEPARRAIVAAAVVVHSEVVAHLMRDDGGARGDRGGAGATHVDVAGARLPTHGGHACETDGGALEVASAEEDAVVVVGDAVEACFQLRRSPLVEVVEQTARLRLRAGHHDRALPRVRLDEGLLADQHDLHGIGKDGAVRRRSAIKDRHRIEDVNGMLGQVSQTARAPEVLKAPVIVEHEDLHVLGRGARKAATMRRHLVLRADALHEAGDVRLVVAELRIVDAPDRMTHASGRCPRVLSFRMDLCAAGGLELHGPAVGKDQASDAAAARRHTGGAARVADDVADVKARRGHGALNTAAVAAPKKVLGS
mmetsp:Transcript_84614/g.244559  ORF Transcript_84614/g.244559 Transcript_84614/m.244559 type:complete len:520 (-) Transcript_84614:367-1926(-)